MIRIIIGFIILVTTKSYAIVELPEGTVNKIINNYGSAQKQMLLIHPELLEDLDTTNIIPVGVVQPEGNILHVTTILSGDDYRFTISFKDEKSAQSFYRDYNKNRAILIINEEHKSFALSSLPYTYELTSDAVELTYF